MLHLQAGTGGVEKLWVHSKLLIRPQYSEQLGYTPAFLFSSHTCTIFPLCNIFLNILENNSFESSICLLRKTSSSEPAVLSSAEVLQFQGESGGEGKEKLQEKTITETISPHA